MGQGSGEGHEPETGERELLSEEQVIQGKVSFGEYDARSARIREGIPTQRAAQSPPNASLKPGIQRSRIFREEHAAKEPEKSFENQGFQGLPEKNGQGQTSSRKERQDLRSKKIYQQVIFQLLFQIV